MFSKSLEEEEQCYTGNAMNLEVFWVRVTTTAVQDAADIAPYYYFTGEGESWLAKGENPHSIIFSVNSIERSFLSSLFFFHMEQSSWSLAVFPIF